MRKLDKYRGCLVGGAAGDALGYAVEFLTASEIFDLYGKQGITEYKLVNGEAQISDDTQMTLFTANGLLLKTIMESKKKENEKRSHAYYIAMCYKEWLRTQTEEFPPGYPEENGGYVSWIAGCPELFSQRAPGGTCISAIEDGAWGTIENPINQSKGCGGIMRVAPIGLLSEKKGYTQEEIDRIGAEAAAITHGHELGYIPAAAFVHIIHMVSENETVTLKEAVEDSLTAAAGMFRDAEHLQEFLELMRRAIRLAEEDREDLEAIRMLGEGWVAEETLAIAVYCALKYEKDFDKALIASVNHDGDSDSTGAVTGNILGTYLGWTAIPRKYTDHLELLVDLLQMAEDLFYN